MAGHFLLRNIQQWELISTLSTDRRIHLTNLFHYRGQVVGKNTPPSPGWTTETRDELRKAIAGHPIGNRNNLPPHRYLMLPYADPSVAADARILDALKVWSWVENLKRPTSQGLGLTSLTKLAQEAWADGDKQAAVKAQLQHADVSLEVYFIDPKGYPDDTSATSVPDEALSRKG